MALFALLSACFNQYNECLAFLGEGDEDVPDVPCGVLSQYAFLIASCLYFGVNVGMCMCYLWLCRQPPDSLHGGRLTLCRAGCGFWDTDSTYL